MSASESIVQLSGYINPLFFSLFLHPHLEQKPLAGNHLVCLFLGAVGSV